MLKYFGGTNFIVQRNSVSPSLIGIISVVREYGFYIGCEYKSCKNVIGNFDNHKTKSGRLLVFMLTFVLSFYTNFVCTNIVYAKFTISIVVQMNLCRLMAHVLMLAKGGSCNCFVFAYAKWVLIFFV